MSFFETAVETERANEAHNTEKLVARFGFLRTYFHINMCEKEDCSTCKFLDIYIIT